VPLKRVKSCQRERPQAYVPDIEKRAILISHRKGADPMLRTLAIAIIPVLLAATPSAAVTSQEKMETCKVGAESQQLQGAKRSAFIKKCMAGGNYEPPARKNAAKPEQKK
jgi:hypothetical protein